MHLFNNVFSPSIVVDFICLVLVGVGNILVEVMYIETLIVFLLFYLLISL